MILQRPDDQEAWIKCLNRCVENGLLEAGEVESAIRDDGIEDYFVTINLKQRLFEKSVNKADFGFAYEALYRQLVKVSL